MDLTALIESQKITLDYPGYKGVASRCWLARFGDLAIVSEQADNPGTSAHEAIEIVATNIVETWGIAPENLLLIEAAGDRQPSFARVYLTSGDTFMHITRVKYIGASWEQLTPDTVAAWIGQRGLA